MLTTPNSSNASLPVSDSARAPAVVPDNDYVVESADELVAATSMDGTLTYANQAFAKKLALPSKPFAMPRTKLEILSSTTYLSISKEILSHTRESGSWIGECDLVCMDGGTVPARLKTGRIRGETGSIVGVYYIASDLTEKRENERQLQLLSSIVQCTRSALIGQTTKGIIFSWNKEAERIFGYPAREILGRSADVLLPFDREREGVAILEKLNQGERIEEFETVRMRRDGVALHVSMKFAPIMDRNGDVTGSSIAVQDISQTRRMETQLKHALRFESIGRLAGGIAHEFNNVHSVILGYCDVLSELTVEDRRLTEYVQQIRKASLRAASVTQQLLAFSQKQILEPRVIDLSDAVTEMESLLKNAVGDDVALTVRKSQSPCHIKADPLQIEQVIVRLAIHGRDAMPKGGTLFLSTEHVRLDESVLLKHVYFKPGEYCLLTVSDTGTGMDEATQARIFEPFFTAADQGSKTDFGLAMVYGIVKQSNGFINVYSELGLGTTFKIYLPQIHQPVSTPSAKSPLVALPHGKETVLLVDDDDAFRRVTRILLEGFGYAVVEASSGSSAIEMMKRSEGSIDLLLTDVVMPQMDGPTLASQLQSVVPEIKVVYMSGYTSDLLKFHFGDDSAKTLLVKPFSRSTLALKLRESLQDSRCPVTENAPQPR